MADISNELQAIMDAEYGEEVRGSIHDALEKMNENAEAAERWATGGSGGTASATNNAKIYAERAEAAAATFEVDNTLSVSGKAPDSEITGKEIRQLQESAGYIVIDISLGKFYNKTIDASGKIFVGSVVKNFQSCDIERKTSWKTIKIVSNISHNAYITFLTESIENLDNGDSVNLATGESGRRQILSGNASSTFTIPDDCTVINIMTKSSGANYIPSQVIAYSDSVGIYPTLQREIEKERSYIGYDIVDLASGTQINGKSVGEGATIKEGSQYGSVELIRNLQWSSISIQSLSNRNSYVTFLKETISDKTGDISDYLAGGEEDRHLIPQGEITINFQIPDDCSIINILTKSSDYNYSPKSIAVYYYDGLNQMLQNQINALENTNIALRNSASFDWLFGKRIDQNGNLVSYARGAVTEPIPVSISDVIISECKSVDPKERTVVNFLIEFDVNGNRLERISFTNGLKYTPSEDVSSIRFGVQYLASEEDFPSYANFPRMLNSVFAVRWQRFVTAGDGERPVYVAIGASTTIGGIHYNDGSPVNYTAKAYPTYVGEALGLETHNLALGDTGFMARKSGTRPNFMDTIYQNTDLMARTSLVTILFGYGNDKGAGLPVGEYDDYYPYDEAGHFYVSGAKQDNIDGVTAMIEEGATLFGCLNWCITYISKRYPKVQLVIILGPPSGNQSYPVSVDSVNGKMIFGSSRIDDDPDEPSEPTLGDKFELLKAAWNIPMINLMREFLPFSYIACHSTFQDANQYDRGSRKLTDYVIFSTVTDSQTGEDVWNSHPNENGYLMYSRYLAGQISKYYLH